MSYETMFYPIDKLLVTTNIVMWTFNLVVVLFATENTVVRGGVENTSLCTFNLVVVLFARENTLVSGGVENTSIWTFNLVVVLFAGALPKTGCVLYASSY
jgi:uncharacterized membrane-anchored protein YitT (DUF2179 family)